MKTPLVSIIIPVYNSEKYLVDLLESIINQSYPHLDIICVNDGSTDNSESILYTYQEKDSRIRLFNQTNKGAPSCRNIGLKYSIGEYIIFFDSDDFFYKEAIENLVELAQKKSADIIIGNKVEFLEVTGEYIRETMLKYKSYNLLCYFFQDPLPGNKLISKKFLNKYNIMFDNLKIGQDLCFYLKMLAHYPKIYICDKDILIYRVRKDSISRSYDLRILDIIEVFKNLNNYYIDNNVYFEFQEELNFNQFYHTIAQLYKLQYIKDKNTFDAIYKELINNMPDNILNNTYVKNNKTLVLLYLIYKNRFFMKIFFFYRKCFK